MAKKKGEAIIELKEVWKTYVMGEVQIHALRGLTLGIKKGEFVSILGPSGSGKSTAMALVGCLDTPTKGTILLDGKDISKMTESDLAQIRGKKIGFVFQQFHLMPTLSALKNVMLPTIFQGISQEERLEKAKSLLDMVDLGDRIHHKPSELSGGQMQRVAIARALVNDPDVILADEPTGNLDSKTGKQIVEILKGLHKKGKTVVMVTHDTDLGKMAQRMIRLRDGRCCKKGE
jgi:putative ABC transport system ATP-binding protein